MFQRIVVGYDGSAGARVALRMAFEMAAADHAALTIVAVEEHLPHYGPVVGELEEERSVGELDCRGWLTVALAEAGKRGIAASADLRAGHAAQALATAATEHDADLLILGRSGHSAIWGRFIGSTAEKAARHARCSVLIANQEQPGEHADDHTTG
ncbi:universal stress protein [Nocardia sp. NPDC052566]|uniref:universal stress protein n=1 Tax=Nocardia sp. NPDC052566 TaxID=3364330 RepID=UPI0037C7655D